jgi:hypothetical protein
MHVCYKFNKIKSFKYTERKYKHEYYQLKKHLYINWQQYYRLNEERIRGLPYTQPKTILHNLSKTKLHGLSPHANYTDQLSDRRLSAKLVPTLADRGCRVVSAIPPQSLILVF